MALYARVLNDGSVKLVNGLGVEASRDPLDLLSSLDNGVIGAVERRDGIASDKDYALHVRQVDAATPARYNADPRRLHGASGSAGRVMVFAVRLDTFPSETNVSHFYVGTNDPAELTRLRRGVLTEFENLPVFAEYMHRDAFDLSASYGKDVFLAVRKLGTSRLPWFFGLKARVDSALSRFVGMRSGSDTLLQAISRFE